MPVSELFQAALSASPSRVGTAAREGDRALTRANVRHLLCGGLAVAAHGYTRATAEVDFLIGEEAFDRQGKVVVTRAGLPYEVGGVKINLVRMPQIQADVEIELNHNTTGVVSVEMLILMKITRYQPKDRLDVVELLRVNADRAASVRKSYDIFPRRLAVCERDAQQ